MSTSTQRPPQTDRTPEDTPATMARDIAKMTCASLESFTACIDDNDRDQLHQRLVQQLTDDLPAEAARLTEADVLERLGAALAARGESPSL